MALSEGCPGVKLGPRDKCLYAVPRPDVVPCARAKIVASYFSCFLSACRAYVRVCVSMCVRACERVCAYGGGRSLVWVAVEAQGIESVAELTELVASISAELAGHGSTRFLFVLALR